MSLYVCLCDTFLWTNSVSECGLCLWCCFHSQNSLYRRVTFYIIYLLSQREVCKAEFQLSTVPLEWFGLDAVKAILDQVGSMTGMK